MVPKELITQIYSFTMYIHVPDLVKLKTAIIMFKTYHYMLPMNVPKLFRIHDSRYSSSHKLSSNKFMYVL